jgi:hypothetical protein
MLVVANNALHQQQQRRWKKKTISAFMQPPSLVPAPLHHPARGAIYQLLSIILLLRILVLIPV